MTDGEVITASERPWGGWKVVHEEAAGTVKVLTVNAGGMLSLQTHQQRDEYWVPLVTGLLAYTRNEAHTQAGRLLRQYDVYKVERGTAHRLINPTESGITLVEIINGRYLESDITRLHDSYGRE